MTRATKVPSLDSSVQTTNEWLDEVGDLLGIDREQAYDALKGTLSTLRDSLSVDESSHLAAQLPMLIRGVYYTGWSPSQEPARLDRDEFLEEIRSRGGLGASGPHPLAAARGVVSVMQNHISQGEIDDVFGQLTEELREILAPESS